MNSLIYIILSNSHRGCCKRYLRGVWRSCQSEAQLYNLRKFSAATQDYNNHSLKKLQQSYNADACQFIRYCSTDQTSRGMTKTEKLAIFAITAIFTICSSVVFILYEARALHDHLRLTNNVFETEKESQYIYPKKEIKKKQQKDVLKGLETKVKVKVQKALSKLSPWIKSRTSDDPLVLLHLAESSDPDIRRIGLNALVDQEEWPDCDFRYIAQSSHLRTKIALARMKDADLRFFKRMPRLPPLKNCIEDEFRILLASLPKDNVQECVNHFTSKALLEGKVEEERGGVWCFGGTGLEFTKTISKSPEATVEKFCLEALVFHSLIPEHCIEMVNLGALLLLQRVYLKHSSSVVFRRYIAWILGNIALNQNLHKNIIDGGWLPVLHNWLESKDMALCLHAARALANMDADTDLCSQVKAFYEDGIYLAHPIYRQKDDIYADVVFVHGLLGGPFKSWRQEDRRLSEPGFVVDDEVRKNYTFCWPKLPEVPGYAKMQFYMMNLLDALGKIAWDWLAKDISNIRILNVGYESELSQWNTKCPFETEKRSLYQRSATLIDKLQRADVGSRPVIWVGHSMGGLLIKRILQLADSDPRFREMKRNTIGVIFYSTPHHGSSLAKYSNQAKYMLYPSIEVQELNKENSLLQPLHRAFQQIVEERNIPCLSFGETEKTPVGMKLQVTIVPTESSDPGIGEYHTMPMNHLNICKPKDQNSDLYILTQRFISKCLFQKHVDDVLSFGEFMSRNNK